jgi:hypothetical protein
MDTSMHTLKPCSGRTIEVNHSLGNTQGQCWTVLWRGTHRGSVGQCSGGEYTGVQCSGGGAVLDSARGFCVS